MAELIVALDLSDAPSAVELLDRLPEGCPVKLGSVLVTAAGSGFVRGVVAGGHPVFLDLKWHDIPNTVAGAVRAARGLGVEMVTVHALGGPAMIETAMEAAGGEVKVVAVTVLTSHTPEQFGEIMGRPVVDVGGEVARLAELAVSAGADGVVCSPHEVRLIAPLLAGKRVVVPGVRRAGEDRGDQARAADPGMAAVSGATHLVVGRPIIGAADPAAAWALYAGEAGGGL